MWTKLNGNKRHSSDMNPIVENATETNNSFVLLLSNVSSTSTCVVARSNYMPCSVYPAYKYITTKVFFMSFECRIVCSLVRWIQCFCLLWTESGGVLDRNTLKYLAIWSVIVDKFYWFNWNSFNCFNGCPFNRRFPLPFSIDNCSIEAIGKQSPCIMKPRTSILALVLLELLFDSTQTTTISSWKT